MIDIDELRKLHADKHKSVVTADAYIGRVTADLPALLDELAARREYVDGLRRQIYELKEECEDLSRASSALRGHPDCVDADDMTIAKLTWRIKQLELLVRELRSVKSVKKASKP